MHAQWFKVQSYATAGNGLVIIKDIFILKLAAVTAYSRSAWNNMCTCI